MTRAGSSGSASFGALVPDLSAHWQTSEPDRRHRSLPGTLVSADLSGFTALSERLAVGGRVGAERLTEVVNRCFARLIEEAAAGGGDVLKFGGDALLLWFDGDEHEMRAVAAAGRMQAVLHEPALRTARLRMSVGIASGDLDVFLLGRRQRELVVAGPLSSQVVRLESAATAGQVLLADRTAAALPTGTSEPRPDGSHALRLRAAERLVVGTSRVRVPPAPAAIADLIPRSVRDELAAAELLGGEHRLASVAFASVGSIDERIAADPEAVADDLGALLEDLEAATERYGVTFLYSDVSADDLKLLLSAGVPSSGGEDEESLLRCVHELVERSDDLRVGVHQGPVFAGFLGCPERRTYTVMGDAVNLAARLLGRAAPGQVVASEEILARSRAVFSTVAMEPFLVKGKALPVHARLIDGLNAVHDLPAAATLPMVGRSRELRAIEEAAASAGVGEGRVLDVCGAPGIGKTRLAHALIEDHRLPTKLVAECQPYDTQVAYAGVRSVVRTVVGIPPAADPIEAGRLLTRFVERVAPDQSRWLSLIAAVAGAEVKTSSAVEETALAHRRGRLHEAVIALLTAALPMPSVLLVEDLAFLDDASRQLLRAVVAVVPDRPWVLCVTRRPDVAPLAPDDPRVVSLDVAPLDEADSRALAGLAAHSDPQSDAALAAIADRSGGNPLFVIELVRTVGAHEELPESIERVVATRIDALSPSDRLLLRHAAVVGRTFDLDLVADLSAAVGVLGAGDPRRWAAMSELIQAAGPGRFAFRHAMFRDVAYAALPFGHRIGLHARIGDLLVAQHVDGVEIAPAVLSAHFALGARHDEAWEWSLVAARTATEHGAVVEAVECLERALAAAPKIPDLAPGATSTIAEELCDLRERAGRYLGAIDALKLAQRGPVTPARAARLMRKHGDLRERIGRYSDALRWYTRALKVLDRTDDDPEQARERVGIELAYGGVRLRQGRQRDGLIWIERASQHAAAVGADDGVARAAYLRIGLTGDHQLDRELGELALSIYRAEEDLAALAALHNNLGLAAHDEGRWPEAGEHYARAEALFNRLGDVSRAAMAAYNGGFLLLDQGRLDEADERCAEAHRVWGAADYPLGVALTASARARVAARRGDHYQALVLSDAALDQLRSLGAGALLAEALADRAECAVMAGQSLEALDAVSEARSLGGHVEIEPAVQARLERMAGFAQLQLDNLTKARIELERSLQTAEAEEARFEAALTLRALGQVAERSGDPHGAGYAAEADRLLQQLAVTAIPQVPLPG